MASFLGMYHGKPSAAVEYQWTDVTKDFLSAADGLALGELVHDGTFGLFEAMSAIEMMDPKMDAGMLCNRASKDRALSYDEAVKRGMIKLTSLTQREQIGIMDATYACLVTWLEGHSLAQTVFTNLYLHRPLDAEDVVMRAFSVAILKLVDLLIGFVSRASVYEEEDFQAMTYGFSLCSETSGNKVSVLLKEAEDSVAKARTECAAGDPDLPLVDAVALRLKFTRLLHHVFLGFGKRENNLAPLAKTINSCAELCPMLKDSTEMGIQPTDTQSFPESRVDYPTIMGFEPLVNQRLLPPTFPRYTRILPRNVAYDRLVALMGRLKVVCGVTSCTDYAAIMDYLAEFSGLSPCVISRSIMKLTFMPQGIKLFGTHQMTDVLRDSCKAFIAPPILTNKAFAQANPGSREYVDAFFCHCFRPFTGLLQALGHNRARLRDKLSHLLEEFAGLQEEADKVDQYLHSLWLKTYDDGSQTHLACLGTWVLHHTLKIMAMYLLTGFELELYAVHEYHYIFWYLYEFLYGWTVSALLRADKLVTDYEAFDCQPSNQRNKANKKQRGKKPLRIKPYTRDINFHQGLQELCAGYFKVMTGLRKDGKVEQPYPEFDNERVRYEHRFMPFVVVSTPPLVHYDQFVKMSTVVNSSGDPPTSEELYVEASKHFSQSRIVFEALGDYKPSQVPLLVKIAKNNFVVSKLLATGHQRNSSSPISFDFSVHPHFPVLKFS